MPCRCDVSGTSDNRSYHGGQDAESITLQNRLGQLADLGGIVHDEGRPVVRHFLRSFVMCGQLCAVARHGN